MTMTSIERAKYNCTTYRCLDKRVFHSLLYVSIRLFYSSLKATTFKVGKHYSILRQQASKLWHQECQMVSFAPFNPANSSV